ncbi:unnamed protein product [Rotaria socialis]|uniref:Uncharacterized protein n=1 Tax=Rotaria socialis TaxID=392032 RepID=A0A820SI92_9BILA|nr:unnamed protein product [Rotaria socialis]CAF4143336.1 unnamed protein product [Rotaria socialis]CAF4453285.1 unnamed protein product [Rotaria socialis]CAF4509462.1 unnamed protein product [Rotaria socialis]
MKNIFELPQEQLNSIIMDGDDVIETAVEEVVISESAECQRNKFNMNAEAYKNSLSLCMREKSMIALPFYNRIIHDLKQKKRCAGVEILCSSTNGNRIAVIEHYYQKLACIRDIIDQWWAVNVLVGLFTVPHELVHLKVMIYSRYR